MGKEPLMMQSLSITMVLFGRYWVILQNPFVAVLRFAMVNFRVYGPLTQSLSLLRLTITPM